MNKTFSARKTLPSERQWVLIDATNMTLGRLASKIAIILMGKNKPSYTPHVFMGDSVIVVNAKHIKVTGKQYSDKVYYHHTGWPGGLRKIYYKDLVEKNACLPLYRAVKGMLPKNKLSSVMLQNLRISAGREHTHNAQNPTVITLNV